MELKKSQKIAKKFLCEICDYSTSNNYDFNKHLSTSKHINGNKMEINGINDKNIFLCICGRKYKTQSGLWSIKGYVILKNRKNRKKSQVIQIFVLLNIKTK